jgi:hypothetical protein
MTIYTRQKKYLGTEKGKESNRKSTAKYAQTEAGRESKRLRNQRYFASEHGKAVNRAKVAKYKAAKLQRIPPWVDREPGSRPHHTAARRNGIRVACTREPAISDG